MTVKVNYKKVNNYLLHVDQREEKPCRNHEGNIMPYSCHSCDCTKGIGERSAI